MEVDSLCLLYDKVSPSIQDKIFGLPIIMNALTHGLSTVTDLFVDTGDTIILLDKHWENYETIFQTRRGANFSTYELFNEEGKFHISAFRECLHKQKHAKKAICLLNFPNNPTGYTPSINEMEVITTVLNEATQFGLNLVVILDDAYFGLFYEDSAN